MRKGPNNLINMHKEKKREQALLTNNLAVKQGTRHANYPHYIKIILYNI